MTKEEIQTRLEAAEKQMLGLQDEIKNLKAKLDEVQDEEIPECVDYEVGDRMYYIDTELEVRLSNMGWRDLHFNVFHSEEYAKLFADKCREIAMLLHCKWYVDRDYVPDWDNDEEAKYSVNFSHSQHGYFIEDWYNDKNGTVFFRTADAAQKAADWMNAHAKRGEQNDD